MMRGATIVLASLAALSRTAAALPVRFTPRTVVTPCASHSLYAYVSGVPPCSACTCSSTSPGITHMPVASISLSKSRGGRLGCIGNPGVPAERISVIRLPWMTMSRGPCTVPPDPSMTFTPRITSLVNGPWPSSGPRGGVSDCAPAATGRRTR